MCKKATKQPNVPDALIDALESVLARIWEAECYDYYHGPELAESDRQNHFFRKLEVVRHWLDYVEDDCGRG